MRRLTPANGEIPRGFKDSRTTVARRYRAYCEAAQAQWGPLPAIALGTLREAGRAFVELERLGDDLERVRRQNYRKEAARIRKQQFMLREQLARLERRLEELSLAASNGKRRHDPLAAVRAAVDAANRPQRPRPSAQPVKAARR